MRKLALVLVVVLLGGMFWWVEGSRVVKAGPQADDAGVTARQFAPWLKAFVKGKQQNADQLFKLRPGAQSDLITPEASQTLSRLAQTDSFNLNVVWRKDLGDGMGIVFFTVATADGPVGIKIYYYSFGGQNFISKLDISEHWSEIERMAFLVDPMTGPVVTVPGNDGN